jgi:hypothetical protein
MVHFPDYRSSQNKSRVTIGNLTGYSYQVRFCLSAIACNLGNLMERTQTRFRNGRLLAANPNRRNCCGRSS